MIGDVFLRLLALAGGFEADVVKKADKAGAAGEKTLGARLGGALKTEGVKVFGRAASAAFAVAAAGAAKLEDIQARVRAETGAGAEEARAAAKAINAAAGAEQASLDSVAEIALRVRRDLGAVGKEADELTARFARFARVTRQDGAAAVADFDDILDRWGLTAKDSAAVQNVLIAGWQKFGGTIEGNQKGLAAIAPQLRAMNLGWEDGAALINLFNASGLDATAQVRALNTAVKNLKPGQNLPDLIAEISAIEDPAKRAQRAIEIFGSRGGVELANALGPGIGSLDDFAISAGDVGDKVGEMADIIDSTPIGRLKKFLSEAAAGARDFGFELGTGVTALASLGSLIATLGGGKLLKGLAVGILRPFAGLGVKIATGIATELAASGVATKLGDGLSSAVNKIPGVTSLKSGLGKVGGFMGTTLGKVMGIAAAIAVAVWFVDELNKRRDEVAAKTAEIGQDVANQIAKGTDAQLQQSAATLKKGIDDLAKSTETGFLGIRFARPVDLDTLKGLVAQYNLVQTELNARAALNATVAQNALENARSGTAQAAGALVDEIPTAFQKRQGIIRAAAENYIRKPIGEMLALLGPDGIRARAQLTLDFASGIRDKRSGIDQAIEQLKTDIKKALKPGKEIGRDIGLLMGRAIRTGLKSADPEIRAQAEGTRNLIEARLIELVKSGGKAGQDVLDELAKKMKSKDPDVRAQAARTKSVIDNALKAPSAAKSPGDAIGDELNRALKNKGAVLGRTAYTLGETIVRNLLRGVKGTGYVAPSSPSGSGGKIGGPQEYAEGAWRTIEGPGYLHDDEIVVPKSNADAIRSGAAVLSSTGVTGAGWNGPLVGEVNVDARGRPDAAAVGTAVRDAVGDAVANVLRDQSLRGVVGLRP